MQESSGTSNRPRMAWCLADRLWARLGDGDRALTALTHYVIPRFGTNFFNGGDGFQIDANFGAIAGIAEMLLQSHNDEIHLLPALPETWPNGSVKGLRARGGFEVDINWKAGELVEATIRSSILNEFSLRYRGENRSAKVALGESFRWDGK